MNFTQQQELKARLAKAEEKIEELQDDISVMSRENDKLIEALEFLYNEFENILPITAERLAEDNPTLRVWL